MDILRDLNADPRFYDRCIAVCTGLLAVILLVVAFLFIQSNNTADGSTSSTISVQTDEGLTPVGRDV